MGQDNGVTDMNWKGNKDYFWCFKKTFPKFSDISEENLPKVWGFTL